MERDQGQVLELNTEQSSVQPQILAVADQETKVSSSLGNCLPTEAVKRELQGWDM